MVAGAIDLVRQGGESKLPRLLLFSMFIVLMIDNINGMGIGFALGLSAKNLYLYSIVLLIAVRAASNPRGMELADVDINVLWWLLMTYAVLTWAISSVASPVYSPLRGAIAVKNQLVDLYLFMFAFRYGISSRADYLWLFRAIIVLMFVTSFITLIDYMNIPDLGIIGSHQGRIEGFIGAANQFGALLAFLLPVSIAAIPENQTRAQWLLWRAGIFVTAILLIAAGSRGAVFALISGSIIGVIYLRNQLDMRRVMKFIGVAMVVVVLLVVAFAIFNTDFLLERFEKTTNEPIVTASSGRADIWYAAVLIMLEWPLSFLFGYGWDAYSYSGIWKTAHNEYLDRLYELGVIGLILYVLLLRSTVSRVRRVIHRFDPVTKRIMIGYIIGMMMVFVDIIFVAIPDSWTVIWPMTGLIMGLQATSLSRERERDVTGTS
jgi:O-antigen ligase